MTQSDNSRNADLSGALKLHEAGQLDAAQRAYEAILKTHPRDANAENLLGVLHAQRDDLNAAARRFARATELDPQSELFWFHRGECARRQERNPEAAEWFQKALQIRPAYHDAFINLAAVLALNGQGETFLRQVHERFDANPDAAQNLVQIGQELLARKDSETAARLFAFLNTRQPDNRIIARNLSAALLRLGKFEAALSHLQELVKAHPDWSDGFHILGVCLEELGQLSAAIEAHNRALALVPDRFDTANALVRLHERRRDPASARVILDQLLAAAPDEARAWARLGQHLERTSQIEAAAEAAHAALKRDAHNAVALTTLVQIAAREKDHDRARERIRASEADVRGTPAEIRFSYTAGRVYEAAGEYGDAVDFYHRANALARELPRAQWVRSDTHLAEIEASRQAFEDADTDFRVGAADGIKHDNVAGRAPVFLVGFPRSGTTLLERLLGASPGARITDELPTMHPVSVRLHEITDNPRITPASLEQLTESDITGMRSLYWERVDSLLAQPLAPGDTLIDKNPMSIVELPLIARMFPDSRILVVTRDPRDVCLSCYTTDFILNRTTHIFTDMQKTIQLYRAVMGLWRAVEPALRAQTRVVRYEMLAENVNAHLPDILEFCGLAPNGTDDPSLVAAARAGDWVNTASYNTVSEPVHQRAIARWTQFKDFFEEEFALLEPDVGRLEG